MMSDDIAMGYAEEEEVLCEGIFFEISLFCFSSGIYFPDSSHRYSHGKNFQYGLSWFIDKLLKLG